MIHKTSTPTKATLCIALRVYRNYIEMNDQNEHRIQNLHAKLHGNVSFHGEMMNLKFP